MIKDKLEEIKDQLPDSVTLVAVSKTKPIEMIQEAYEAGQRVFGENRAQELADKHAELPKDIDWHMIGHLQRNKVKYIAPFVNLIQSVDSVRLLKEINKQARKNQRVIPVLLQFHIAAESSKFGFSLDEAQELLQSDTFKEMEHIVVKGVMGMATLTSDTRQVREEFNTLKKIFDHLKLDYFDDEPDFKEISMGMSGDYEMAIAAGSTMIRVGSSIFGSRN